MFSPKDAHCLTDKGDEPLEAFSFILLLGEVING